MKTSKQFASEGYKFLALSENGTFHVTSYIARKSGRKIYGYFDYKLNKYIEENMR